MDLFKHKIESLCAKTGVLFYNNPWKVLLLFSTILIAAVINLKNMTIDASTEGYLRKNDPRLLTYNEFRDTFGRDEIIILGIKSTDIFTIEFLTKLKALQTDIQKGVPYLENVTSLFNAVYIYGEEDELVVEELISTWPPAPGDEYLIKERVTKSPLYRNLLISENADFTAILIETMAYSPRYRDEHNNALFLTTDENKEIISALEKLLNKYNSKYFRLYMAGSPVLIESVKIEMLYNFKLFIALSLVVIFLFLFLLFRRVFAIFIPLLITLLSLVAAISFMVVLEIPLTIPIIILPAFILSISVGGSIHILSIFYQNYTGNRSKKDAIYLALKHSGLAVIMTSFTTMAGLMAFSTAEIKPLSDLGIISAFGIFSSLIYTITLLPAFIAVIPMNPGKPSTKKGKFFKKIIKFISFFTTKHPVKITAGSILIILISIAGISRIFFTFDLISWLPNGFPLKESTEMIDRHIKGANTIEVLIDTREENGLYKPGNIIALEKSAKEIINFKQGNLIIGKCISLADFIKEIHKALNSNDPAFYKVPGDAEIIAQELLLFEMSGSDELKRYADFSYQTARFTIKLTRADAAYYSIIIEQIEKCFNKYFEGKADVTITGMASLFSRIFRLSIRSAIRSYMIAFTVISLFMLFFISDLKIGLLSMVPNILPVLFILGCIGISGMGLDMFTMLIGSIAIGLAVDDTIHFIHNFKKYYNKTGDPRTSVYMTLRTSGHAMLITSLTLTAGFLIFIFSSMGMLTIFGYVTAATVMTALCADFILAPALMTLIYRNNI